MITYRALVTGGRDWDPKHVDYVFLQLDQIHKSSPLSVLINGKAAGFDSICRSWAISRDIPTIDCPANWKKYGRAAGPIRNQEMFDIYHPTILIVGDGGTGTKHMHDYVKSKVDETFPIVYINKPSEI